MSAPSLTSRRRWLAGALALPFLLLLPPSCGERPAPRRPDVFLLVIDTLRNDRLGCYGWPRETSPVIDRLAIKGTLFENVTAQAAGTQPSMTSMFSGRYLTADRDFPEGDWTLLAESFQSVGYRTVGITANPILIRSRHFADGFDEYVTMEGDEPSRTFEELTKRLRALLAKSVSDAEKGERQPLFVYIQAFDPHTEYVPHPGVEERLPAGESPTAELPPWHRARLEEAGRRPDDDDPDWRAAWQDLRHLRGLYEQEVRFLDDHLGLELQRWKRLGFLDHAVLAITGDHGEGLWDHISPLPPERLEEASLKEFFHHQHTYHLYEEAIGTPFILWGSGIPAGLRIEEPVENVDVHPTLLHLAGIAPPDRLDGRSLVDLMNGEADEWRRYTFAYTRQAVCVRDDETGLKLIDPTPMGHELGYRPELYDLAADPDEHDDLASERPDEVERLRAVLADWIARYPMTPGSNRRTLAELKQLQALGYVGDWQVEDEPQGAEPPEDGR